jgi:hypothetical protein
MMQQIADGETEELNRKRQQSEPNEQSGLPAGEETTANNNKYDNFVSKS